jgi:hypothetical protein
MYLTKHFIKKNVLFLKQKSKVMKKNILLITVIYLITFTISLKAQTIQLGAKLGANTSWAGQPPKEYTRDGINLGFTGGAWVHLSMKESDESGFFLRPEINYSTFGSKVSNTTVSPFGSTNKTDRFIFGALDIPISLGYRIMIGETFELRLYGGSSYATIMSAKQINSFEIKNTQLNLTTSGEETKDIKESVRNNAYSYILGAGLGINRLQIDLRYQSFITNMYKDFTTDELKPSMIQVAVGYRLF